MIPDEGGKASSEPSQTSPPKGYRRSRRGGRRHSRRRGPPRPSAAQPGAETAEAEPVESAEAVETAESAETADIAETESPAPITPREREQAEPRRAHEPSPRTPALTDAIEQVTDVIEELKHALSEMEEVLETLELAERQKIDDDREIEALQRALRQLHQPRQTGGSSRR